MFFEDLDLSGGASSASARKDRRSPRAIRILIRRLAVAVLTPRRSGRGAALLL
jgi:hypothetical protein